MDQPVLSTAYFPNLNYCSLLKNNTQVSIDLGEHFIKQSIRSRCEILGPNGVLILVVPLKKWRNNTPVRDIQISYDNQWQKLHWKSLESAYRSSPYFEYYEDKLNKLIIGDNHQFLKDLNVEIMNFIIESLDLNVVVTYTNEYIEDVESAHDYRIVKNPPTNSLSTGESYIQVFSDRRKFIPNLSILDLMCNEGPNSVNLFP